jgi:UPF0271 protein
MVMQDTLRLCKKYNVIVGAHPGYPDLMGFGRRIMEITNEEAKAYVIYQIGALKNFADQYGLKIRTAKPHGAFYQWAMRTEERAKAVMDGLLSIGRDLEAVHFPALPVCPLHEYAEKAGLRVVPEIYPGLVYSADGNPGVTRVYEADVESDARIIEHWLETGKVVAGDGTEVEFSAECIQVHGDMVNAPEIIMAIKKVLEKEGVDIRPALG